MENANIGYVIAAYVVIWFFTFAYIVRVGRKISQLENEITELKK